MTGNGQEERKKKKFHLPFRRRAKKAIDEKQAAAKVPAQTPAPSEPPRVVRVNSDVATRNKKKASKKPRKEDPKLKPSWLARRRFFIKMADQAFELVDADGSGEVDEKELYSGLLLIHLKLGCYAGPAACKPVDRERVHDIFEKMDIDDSGSLDRNEFREVMMILFSNVLIRVVVQWSMTLMIVPLVAQFILDGIYHVWTSGIALIQRLDEHSVIFDAIELFLEDTRDKIIEHTPAVMKTMFGYVDKVIQMIPESVWNTIPLTLLSCILGCIAVPWILFKIDDYFQKLAHEKVK